MIYIKKCRFDHSKLCFLTQISFKRGQYPPEWQSQIWLLETGDKGVSMLRNIQRLSREALWLVLEV
ncbi:hypothetical protein CDL62_14890 [Alkalitalea saponilacus]|nr:hypothetical protein CDL62_14890 [Alkalitalea saponilacus]